MHTPWTWMKVQLFIMLRKTGSQVFRGCWKSEKQLQRIDLIEDKINKPTLEGAELIQIIDEKVIKHTEHDLTDE